MAYGNYAPFYRGGYFNPMQTPQMPNMAENQGYMPQYQQQMPMSPTQMSGTSAIPTNDMIWVLNENEATSYPVAPNNSVVLWDKSNPTIYVKSVNAQGIPSMRTLDFVERVQNGSQMPVEHVCKCGDKFVTKDELKALQGKYDDLTAKYDDLMSKMSDKPKTTAKKSKGDEE